MSLPNSGISSGGRTRGHRKGSPGQRRLLACQGPWIVCEVVLLSEKKVRIFLFLPLPSFLSLIFFPFLLANWVVRRALLGEPVDG